jgi:beta-phosphoglucomutase-like phosphatase (HAD superfamily)
LFDSRVDGQEINRLSLKGKPAPDTFLDAARHVEAEPSRAVVVEVAIAGIKAGRAGGFGLVIGVDHSGRPEPLREAGADFVVTSLAQVEHGLQPALESRLAISGEFKTGKFSTGTTD